MVKCRPSGNRAPEPDEREACWPNLRAQIRLVQPAIVLLLGATALQGLIDPQARITRLRGEWIQKEGIWFMPTYHPAALLRDPSKKKDVWEDMKAVIASTGRSSTPSTTRPTMRDAAKRLAGEKAAEFVQDQMIVGLGTGSTAYWAIRRLGERVREGLQIRAIPTSNRTRALAREAGIPLIDWTTETAVGEIDLTIDGADEIAPSLDLIKGGGGALLREKLVAAASRQVIIVADQTKRVEQLGAFPLPVEVVPFGWEVTLRRIAGLGCSPTLRMAGERPYLTDNGNYVADARFGIIANPQSLHSALRALPGVVETGLFPGLASLAVIASEEQVELVTPK